MKEKLTIGEMAKLRGMTIETLRHYDRIHLFKPTFVDRHTGYRYYSIYQYEILGTIKELRQIGMNTDEIKQYLNERNIRKSLEILKNKHTELESTIREWVDIEENIREKINFLETVCTDDGPPEVMFRDIKSRRIITLYQKINSNLELCYGVIGLENMLTETAPILASNRLGVLIDIEDLINQRFEMPSTIFVVAKEKTHIQLEHLKIIPAGPFACIRYYGELWDRRKSLSMLVDQLNRQSYRIIGDAVQIMQVDITITDNPNEVMFEIQVPIEEV